MNDSTTRDVRSVVAQLNSPSTMRALVVMCTDRVCKKVERVDVQTLQRLAERLGVTCYQCKGTNLESQSGKFGNYLKCRDAAQITRGKGSARGLENDEGRT